MNYVPSMSVLYFLFHSLVCPDIVVSATHSRTQVQLVQQQQQPELRVASNAVRYIRISAIVQTQSYAHDLSISLSLHSSLVITQPLCHDNKAERLRDP